MTAALKIEPVKVKTYVDRVESLEKEKQAIGDDVREVYDEAKKAGLNTKALRKIVAKRRAKAPDPQVEAAMHAYELALDEAAAMVSNGDVSLRAATARTGFSKSAIQRQVSHRKRDAVSGTEPPHDADGVITDASPKPDAETIAWAEKVAAELPREPQSTRPLKDFIAERRAASKITGPSPKAPDASSAVTARATDDRETGEASQGGESRFATSDCGLTAATAPLGNPEREARSPTISTTGDAQGEDDELQPETGRGRGDDAQHEHDGRDDRLGGEATASRPEGAPNGLEWPRHVAGAPDAGRQQQDDAALRLHAHSGREPGAVAVQPDGPSGDGLGDRDGVGAGEDQRGVEQASTPPPTESLGAVARPSSAERVASTINPEEDDLKIPLFLTKAGQRASAPSKE